MTTSFFSTFFSATSGSTFCFLASFFFWFLDRVDDIESSAPAADLARREAATSSSSSAARFLGLLSSASEDGIEACGGTVTVWTKGLKGREERGRASGGGLAKSSRQQSSSSHKR